jgi:hypothetical protein
MAEQATTDTTTTGQESNTQTAGGQQAADSTATGAATQAATTTEASDTKTDKAQQTKIDTDSQDFKNALTDAIRNKMPQLLKQARKEVAKELSGEKEGEPTVEQLKGERDTLKAENIRLKARDQLGEFVADKRNQIQAGNQHALFKYIKDDLQFDDDGKVTNFKEVLAQAKNEAPELFRGTSMSIDAGNGSRQQPVADMNALIRGR